MGRATTGLIKAALSAMHYTGIGDLMAPLTRGVGVIFTLHNVVPEAPAEFEPSRILKVTPGFLETVLDFVTEQGFDVTSLDEAHHRLAEGDFDRPFACFTFDDGYKDNRQYAYPIFKRRNLPFAIYVATDLVDGVGDLWWLKLEKVVTSLNTVEVKLDGKWQQFECRTAATKDVAYSRMYWWLRSIDETEARQIVDDLCRLHEIDTSKLCSDLIMTWDEIRDLASDPLVTIGAHTRSHRAIGRLAIANARREIEESVQRISMELGRPCRHFSFPYGDASSAGPRDFQLARELGLKTAVTTRKGLLQPEHATALTGLPRVSLNGDFQKSRYVKVLLSGAPFAVLDAAQRPLRALRASTATS